MKTILVVEDEQELREILADTLKRNDFAALEAQNGKEGLKIALAKHPDLIILDLLMPIMGGVEVLQHLRADDWGKHVPVMVLTNLSASDEQLVQEMVALRPVCYIIKSSWDMKSIVAKIRGTLDMH